MTILSVFQSAVSDLAGGSGAEIGTPSPLVEAAGRLASLRAAGASDVAAAGDVNSAIATLGEPQTCVTLELQYFEARVRGDTTTADRIAEELKDSPCDPKWLSTLGDYLGYFGLNGTPAKIPYVRSQRQCQDRDIWRLGQRN